jgi:hypothetical protein
MNSVVKAESEMEASASDAAGWPAAEWAGEVDEAELESLDDELPDVDFDLSKLDFDGLEDLEDVEAFKVEVKAEVVDPAVAMKAMEENLEGKLDCGPGLLSEPDPELLAASKGQAKQKSFKNNQCALLRADQLRRKLGWDMSVPLGDLPFKDLDVLLSNLFARLRKKNGELYPSETIMNMVGGYNRILVAASELRYLEARGDLLKANFNIKKHLEFPKTKLVIRAAVKKSAREGKNKKRHKVSTLTIAMEKAILSDIDHQINSSTGCQKRLAFYIMCRLGIRGGTELHSMLRTDLKIKKDDQDKEYIE